MPGNDIEAGPSRYKHGVLYVDDRWAHVPPGSFYSSLPHLLREIGMRSKLKWITTYVAVGCILFSFLGMFVIDARDADKPQAPDPQTGRIFERGIKYHGPVYLTAAEFAPYKWLYTTILVSCGLVVAVHLIDFAYRKINSSE